MSWRRLGTTGINFETYWLMDVRIYLLVPTLFRTYDALFVILIYYVVILCFGIVGVSLKKLRLGLKLTWFWAILVLTFCSWSRHCLPYFKTHCFSNFYWFLRATAYMLSAHMLSQFRPSICPSVTRVDQSKTVEVSIMQLSPHSSPIPLVFAR